MPLPNDSLLIAVCEHAQRSYGVTEFSVGKLAKVAALVAQIEATFLQGRPGTPGPAKPVFDQEEHACPVCQGAACGHCDGTGKVRITFTSSATPPPGPGSPNLLWRAHATMQSGEEIVTDWEPSLRHAVERIFDWRKPPVGASHNYWIEKIVGMEYDYSDPPAEEVPAEKNPKPTCPARDGQDGPSENGPCR